MFQIQQSLYHFLFPWHDNLGTMELLHNSRWCKFSLQCSAPTYSYCMELKLTDCNFSTGCTNFVMFTIHLYQPVWFTILLTEVAGLPSKKVLPHIWVLPQQSPAHCSWFWTLLCLTGRSYQANTYFCHCNWIQNVLLSYI